VEIIDLSSDDSADHLYCICEHPVIDLDSFDDFRSTRLPMPQSLSPLLRSLSAPDSSSNDSVPPPLSLPVSPLGFCPTFSDEFVPSSPPLCAPISSTAFTPTCPRDSVSSFPPEYFPPYSPECVPYSPPEFLPSSPPEYVPSSSPEYDPSSTPDYVPSSPPEYVPSSPPEYVPTSPAENVPVVLSAPSEYIPVIPVQSVPTVSPLLLLQDSILPFSRYPLLGVDSCGHRGRRAFSRGRRICRRLA
jgi:hypothetical protein